MTIRQLSAAVAVGALLAIVPAPPVYAAPASTVSCGAVLTRSASLSGNLYCPDSTITVRGNNIRLNFKGYTLHGNGTSTGVRIEGTGARLEHGTIKNFDHGILGSNDVNDDTYSGWFAKVNDMVISHNRHGILSDIRVYVIGSRILDNVRGLASDGQSFSVFTVSKSTLARNGDAIRSLSERHITYVSHSVFDDNGVGIGCSQSRVVVSDSRFRRNHFGVELFQCDGSRIERSHLLGNEKAIYLDHNYDSAIAIHDNYLHANGIGIRVMPLTVSNIVSNSFRSNRIGVASDAIPSFPLLPVIASQLTANRFNGNGNGVLLEHKLNIVISDNKAFNNRGWGIYTVGGTDGGGNLAGGNTEPAQCFGVVCL